MPTPETISPELALVARVIQQKQILVDGYLQLLNLLSAPLDPLKLKQRMYDIITSTFQKHNKK